MSLKDILGMLLQASTPPDWEKGLPLELLALLAGLGGRNEMKAMRGVCKLWQQGFEGGTIGLMIGPEGPLLPGNGSFCERFPMLASLHLGDSPVAESDLAQLAGFKQLQTLSLGTQSNCFAPRALRGQLFSSLRGSCFEFWGGLGITDLSLRCCEGVKPADLERLKGLPLARLDISGAKGILTREGIEHLRGLPLTSLDISGLESKNVLEGIREMPLVALEMRSGWPRLQDDWLEPLVGLPLTSLNLSAYPNDDASDAFYGFNLFDDFFFPYSVLTGAGLENLREMPLTSLNLARCDRLGDADLEVLTGMPLITLDLVGCNSLTSASLGFCVVWGFRI